MFLILYPYHIYWFKFINSLNFYHRIPIPTLKFSTELFSSCLFCSFWKKNPALAKTLLSQRLIPRPGVHLQSLSQRRNEDVLKLSWASMCNKCNCMFLPCHVFHATWVSVKSSNKAWFKQWLTLCLTKFWKLNCAFIREHDSTESTSS